MGQYFSGSFEQPTCSEKNALEVARKIANSTNVDQVISFEQVTVSRTRDGEIDKRVSRAEITALCIACLFKDKDLVNLLIRKGADLNKISNFNYNRSATPLFCAVARGDVEIVKILLNAGADVNRFQGQKQCINLQEPPDTRAIIGPFRSGDISPFLGKGRLNPADLPKVLELYLLSGVKLNTTSWGPCLFLGRGKVYEADRPTTLHIDGPWFVCTASVILLQHGVDPNLYNADDVLYQMVRHNRYGNLCRYGDKMCVKKTTLFETFLAAGYNFTETELRYYEKWYEKSTGAELYCIYGVPSRLKHLCRTAIRRHIRSVNADTSVFRVIDGLKLPTILKDYLKLYDVVPRDISSVLCEEYRR